VVLVTPRERIAADVPLVSALGIQRRLALRRVEVRVLSEVSGLSDLESGVVRVRNVHTGDLEEVPDVALLTYATPRTPLTELEAPLRERKIPLSLVGDCYAPRTVLAATSDGHRIGNAL
jgi:hypothetical protein